MPSGITRKYAPDDIALTVGTQSVIGVQEGTFFEAERTVDISSMHVGSDGEATLAISPNQSGTFKITLQQASPLNDYFASLHLAIQNKNTAVGVVPIRGVDKNGTTVVSSLQGAIQKVAKITFADKPEAREWTFLCGYLNIVPGGESSV